MQINRKRNQKAIILQKRWKQVGAVANFQIKIQQSVKLILKYIKGYSAWSKYAYFVKKVSTEKYFDGLRKKLIKDSVIIIGM